jgi:hypothetical protein
LRVTVRVGQASLTGLFSTPAGQLIPAGVFAFLRFSASPDALTSVLLI